MRFLDRSLASPIKAHDVEPMLVKGWHSVADGGPTLNQRWFLPCVRWFRTPPPPPGLLRPCAVAVLYSQSVSRLFVGCRAPTAASARGNPDLIAPGTSPTPSQHPRSLVGPASTRRQAIVGLTWGRRQAFVCHTLEIPTPVRSTRRRPPTHNWSTQPIYRR